MQTYTERINHVVDSCCHGNMSEFARRVNISPQYAAQLCSGARTSPSARIEGAIVREFGLNAEWLRSGVGEMREQKRKSESVLFFDIGDVDMLNRFVRLTPANKRIVEALVSLMLEEQEQEARLE